MNLAKGLSLLTILGLNGLLDISVGKFYLIFTFCVLMILQVQKLILAK